MCMHASMFPSVLVYICHTYIHTLPINEGIFAELVANPIPNTIASSFPTNRAVRASNSFSRQVVPNNLHLKLLVFMDAYSLVSKI